MPHNAVNSGSNTAIGILFVAVLTVVLLLAAVITFSAVNTAELSSNGPIHYAGKVANQTLTTVTEAGENFTYYGYPDASCTSALILNATNNYVINQVGNYTITACRIYSIGSIPLSPGSSANETLAAMDEAGETLTNSTLADSVCTVTGCINTTDTVVIGAGNYTVNAAACTIAFSSVNAVDVESFNNSDWQCSKTFTYTANNMYNNTNWKASYSWAYNEYNTTSNIGINSIQASLVSMIINFFAMMPTVGTILAVIILVGAIVLLVIYVQKMKGSGSQGGDQTFAG